MPSGRDLWLLLPRHLRIFPADLTTVVALTILTILVVFLPVVQETPLRVVFGLPFVLFLPGYAFIAALFPEAGESPIDTEPDGDSETETDESGWAAGVRDRGIDGIERVALSFGLSIAIVPLIGLVLNFTPWGIRLTPIMIAVSGFTIVAAVIAAVRRWELPPEERFSVPYREWLAAGRAELFEPDDRIDATLNVLLALSILLAVGSVGYAIAVPAEGERFSEFYLLTENDDGELVAADYPSEFVQGEGQPLVVGIGNNEHETVSYVVVIQLQQVEHAGNETTVAERAELDRFETTLAHNETWHHHHEVAPTLVGEELRLTYLLYTDEVPETPTRENAYRDLHLWVDVEDAD